MFFTKTLKYTFLPFIVYLVIFYLCCLIPPSDVPSVEFDFFIPADKIVHYLMYLGLSGVTAINYIYLKNGKIVMSKMLIYAFLLPILYGGLIEILQANFFSPRTGDWADFLADVLGSLSAFPIAVLFKKYLSKKTIV